MKNLILTGLISAGFFFSVNAQNWSRGTLKNIYYNQGNVGIGINLPAHKLHVYSGFNDVYYSKFEAQYLANKKSVVDINANSGGGEAQGTGLSINMTNAPYGAGFSRGIYVNVINATRNYAAIFENGNVGIGTTSPAYKLEVFSGLNDANYSKFEAQFLAHQKSIVEINGNSGNTDGAQGTGLTVSMTNGASGSGWNRGIYVNVINGAKNYAAIFENGDVGIGTTNPAYKLDVCGVIRAKEVKVDVAGGCDFVFKNGYKLMDLKHLEEFVTENQHLPEIATEEQMIEKGVDLKDLQMKLLLKIEELTLYAIEQNKQMDKQNQRIVLLENEIKELSKNK